MVAKIGADELAAVWRQREGNLGTLQNSTNYDDGLIACQDTELVIRRCYFPFALPKRVRYDRIRSVRRFELTGLTGSYRAWGSGNLDLGRHRKRVGTCWNSVDGCSR